MKLRLIYRNSEKDFYYTINDCFEEFVSVVKKGETKEAVDKNAKRLYASNIDLPKEFYDKIYGF
jgi:hypothetical protein